MGNKGKKQKRDGGGGAGAAAAPGDEEDAFFASLSTQGRLPKFVELLKFKVGRWMWRLQILGKE